MAILGELTSEIDLEQNLLCAYEGSYLKTWNGSILKQKPRYFDNHEGYEKTENRVL